MRNQWAQGGALGSLLYGDTAGDMDEDQDSLKEAMLDTNPYLLGLTFVVSVVHSIFEFLAFKNGIIIISLTRDFGSDLLNCRHPVLAPKGVT